MERKYEGKISKSAEIQVFMLRRVVKKKRKKGGGHSEEGKELQKRS